MAHVLLVAAWAPPSSNIGARRTANAARFLAARGHRVSVLASTASGDGDVDGACRTVRAFDLLSSPLNWRRGQVAALSEAAASSYDTRPSTLSRFLVPDPTVLTWAPFATRAALALHGRDPVDCVVSSAPPLAAHLAGLALAARGVAWVADFRDGWNFEDLRAPFAFEALAAADRALERHVLGRADRVVATTATTAAAFERLAPGRVETIPNGYDPSTAAGERAPRHRGAGGVVVHTGRLGARTSTLRPVLAAVERLRARGRLLELTLAGPVTRDESTLLGATDREVARHAGNVPWQRSVELQREADVLLLLVDDARPGAVPAKLYEYLAASRPILVVGPPGEAARIVQRTSTGLAVAPDADRVADALAALLDGPPPRNDAAVADYDWRNLAARFDETIAAAIASRRGA